MSNISASARGRLASLARKQGISFQLVIIRYLQERLIYRLSQSRYRDNFYLKGGALVYALQGSKTRFTLDILCNLLNVCGMIFRLPLSIPGNPSNYDASR